MTMLHALVERMVARLDQDNKLSVNPVSCTGEMGLVEISYPAGHRENEDQYLVTVTKQAVGDVPTRELHGMQVGDSRTMTVGDHLIVVVLMCPRGWYVTQLYPNGVTSHYVPDHDHDMHPADFDPSLGGMDNEFCSWDDKLNASLQAADKLSKLSDDGLPVTPPKAVKMLQDIYGALRDNQDEMDNVHLADNRLPTASHPVIFLNRKQGRKDRVALREQYRLVLLPD